MRSILFDYGGTLDADGATWLERFRSIYKEEGVAPNRERFDRAFYDADDALPRRPGLARAGLEETLRAQVDAVLAALAPEKRALSERIAGRFLEDSRRAFRRNRPVLERLRRSYRLGIVSNFYGNLDSVLRAEGLRDLFDAVADSGVLGVEKPAPGIFRHALSELGCREEEGVMVGDSVPRDMRGAEALGMPHALLAAPQASACCPKALRVASLPELEERLS